MRTVHMSLRFPSCQVAWPMDKLDKRLLQISNTSFKSGSRRQKNLAVRFQMQGRKEITASGNQALASGN